MAKLLGLMLLGALLMGGYGIARPGTDQLFVQVYGARSLPWGTLATAVGVVIVVAVYNRLAGGHRLIDLFGRVFGLSAVLLVALLTAVSFEIPGAAFVLYVWKEIYIVVLVEMFWTYANMTFPLARARWIYGLFLAAGSGGAMLGNISQALLVKQVGAVGMLWLVVPILLAGTVGAELYARFADDQNTASVKRSVGIRESVEVMQRSPFLFMLFLLVAITQIVITLVDYRYNEMLELAYPVLEDRTEIHAWVMFATNTSATVLQLGSGVVLKLATVSGTLLLIPLLLGVAVGGAAAFGNLTMMLVAKVASKAFDYSIFRASKETLYIPLSPDEKVQGKAIVDIMAYRVAKGGASLLRLSVPAVAVLPAILGLLAAWLAVTAVIVRRNRSL